MKKEGVINFCLAILFVILGTTNTLLLKFENENISKGCGTSPPVPFSHPLLQTSLVFLGMLLFLPFAYIIPWVITLFEKKQKHVNRFNLQLRKIRNEDEDIEQNKYPMLLLFPAICDIIGSSFLFWGLVLTWASVFQMLNGKFLLSLTPPVGLKIIFTALVSFTLLRRRIHMHHVFGLVIVFTGGVIVSVYSITKSHSKAEALNPLLGICVIICGEIFKAIKFSSEEAILKKFTPLFATGVEGLLGFCCNSIVLFVFYFLSDSNFGSMENIPVAFCQLINNKYLLMFCILQTIEMGIFNYFSMVVTKRIGATIRCIIDELRIIGVWVVQLARRREEFSFFQFSGFIMLVIGTLLYNQIVHVPFYSDYFFKFRSKNGLYYKSCKKSTKDVQDIE